MSNEDDKYYQRLKQSTGHWVADPPVGITSKRWHRLTAAMSQEAKQLGFDCGIVLGVRHSNELLIFNRTVSTGLAAAMESEPWLISSSPNVVNAAPSNGRQRFSGRSLLERQVVNPLTSEHSRYCSEQILYLQDRYEVGGNFVTSTPSAVGNWNLYFSAFYNDKTELSALIPKHLHNIERLISAFNAIAIESFPEIYLEHLNDDDKDRIIELHDRHQPTLNNLIKMPQTSLAEEIEILALGLASKIGKNFERDFPSHAKVALIIRSMIFYDELSQESNCPAPRESKILSAYVLSQLREIT